MKNNKKLSDAEVWDTIYREAKVLYEEYLNVSTFDELAERARGVYQPVVPTPNYDVPLTVRWDIKVDGLR